MNQSKIIYSIIFIIVIFQLFVISTLSTSISNPLHDTTTYTNPITYSDDLDLLQDDLDQQIISQYSQQQQQQQQQPSIEPHFQQLLQSTHFGLRTTFAETLDECQGELQCWLNNLKITLPTIPFNISGIIGNMTNFECTHVNVDSIGSGTNPPPYPELEDFSEIHMNMKNAGLNCHGTFYYNMTFFPYIVDFANFTATVNETNVDLQVYIQSKDGESASATRQGECNVKTRIGLEFEGSVSALILSLIKQPLIDLMTNAIQDNLCLITRDIINITVTDMIGQFNQAIAPTLHPHQDLPPVTEAAATKSIPFNDLQVFNFLDTLLNGNDKTKGIFSNPAPINCIVDLLTNHTGNFTINTYNQTDPTSFMPNITIPVPEIANITIGIPSIVITNLNTIQSLHLLHGSKGQSFDFENGFAMSRLKIFANMSLIVETNKTMSEKALHENFLIMIDLLQPELEIDIRSVVDKSRLYLAKLGAFCQKDGLLPCLISLFEGTWSGNGGLQFALLGLHAKYSIGILPLAPNDSPLEKDLDALLNNIVLTLSQKFGVLFSKMIYGAMDNIGRPAINTLLANEAKTATNQCTAVEPHWDGKSNTPLIWKKSIVYKLLHWVIHDLFKGYNGTNDFIQCAWNGGHVGPDHDFDHIILPDQQTAVKQWNEHFQLFNNTFNLTNQPLMEVFNQTMRGLDSLYKLEFFKPGTNNETHQDNDFRLSGEFGMGQSPNNSQSNTCRMNNNEFHVNNDENCIESIQSTTDFSITSFLTLATQLRQDDDNQAVLDQLINLVGMNNNNDKLTTIQRRELYGDFVQNMVQSHEYIVKYVAKLHEFNQKQLTNGGLQQLHNTNHELNDNNDLLSTLASYFERLDTSELNDHDKDYIEQEMMNFADNLSSINGLDLHDDELLTKFVSLIQDLHQSTPQLITTKTKIINIDDLSTLNQNQLHSNLHWGIINEDVLQAEATTTTTDGMYNGDLDIDDESTYIKSTTTQQLNDDPQPPTPHGPLKIWLAMAVPISRRYIVLNTTIVVDSFQIDGTFYLQINKDKLYDLTIAKALSLCLPSVFEGYRFENFNGHAKGLTLVLDVLMDPKSKLFHFDRTGQEFIDKVNKALEQDALPIFANLTTSGFDALVWASTYACADKPIPGAPKIVDSLHHRAVEWLAILVPTCFVAFVILYSFILLSTKEGTQNWSKFFCRAGRGSSKGHVVLSKTSVRETASQVEKQYNSKQNSANNSFEEENLFSSISHDQNTAIQATAKKNNNSLSLSSANTGFVEEYHPIQLPHQPAYGVLNFTGSINCDNNDKNTNTYQPPIMTTEPYNGNDTQQQHQSPTKSLESTSPTSFPQPTNNEALINLNTLSLESGLSIDTLTGASLLHSPTLPLLLRITVLVTLFSNALLFLVSNMSNGAAVTLIITLFERQYDVGVIFNFTLISTIEDMWKAKVYVLFVLIGAFSGFLPYFKIFLMMICWVVPPHQMSVKWREFILVWLDRLGKWSLLDAFVFCLMFVAFRMHLPVLGDKVLVDSIIRSDPGFYFFLLATMMSMSMSHLILAFHRHALTPYVVEKGGPKRSIHQHYHTLFVIDQTSEYYNQQQDDLITSLPECQEYNELLEERHQRKQKEEDKYKKSLEKLGYSDISVTSLDPYNVGLNSTKNNIHQQTTLTTTTTTTTSNDNIYMQNQQLSNQLESSPSLISSGSSMFEPVDPITGEPIQRHPKVNNNVFKTPPNSPHTKPQQFAIKLRITTFGTILLVLSIIATTAILFIGSFIDTFDFRFGGISGWLLGNGYDSHSWSVVNVGVKIPAVSRDPSAIGVHWIQFTYFAFAIFMPAAFLLVILTLLLYPFTLRAQKALHILAEVFFAWSGVDVFIVSILAAVLQISQLAESLVGDKCDFILPFLHDYMHDTLEDHDKCFVVLAKYKAGSVYLIAAAVLLLIIGVITLAISTSTLTDRMNKYFRLVQYALYNKQLQDGTLETRLIPFESHLISNNDDIKQDALLESQHGIVTGHHKNQQIVQIVHAIIKQTHADQAPVEHIPGWFTILRFFEKLKCVTISRSGVVEDVFGWSKNDTIGYGWSPNRIQQAITNSRITEGESNDNSTNNNEQQQNEHLFTPNQGKKVDNMSDDEYFVSLLNNEPSLTTTANNNRAVSPSRIQPGE